MNPFIMTLGCLLLVCGAVAVQSQAKTSAQNHRQLDRDATIRESAWKLLEEGAREKNLEKRAKMIHALGLLGPEPKAVELAEAGLEDKEPQVRIVAARVLGQMGSTKSVPKLVAATSDRKISVALAAAHSLVALKSDAGYDVYYAVMTGQRKEAGMIEEQWDELRSPKNAAEFAFNQGIGFVPYAPAAYEAIQMLTKKDPSPIRAAAAIGLVHDPNPRSGTALAQAVKDKNWIVRVAALRAIAMRGDHEMLGAVEAMTQDKREEVRFAAAVAVLKLTAEVK